MVLLFAVNQRYAYQLCMHTLMSQTPLVLSATGELDPDRVGSGIQYGNAQLRRPQQPGQSTGGKKECSC